MMEERNEKIPNREFAPNLKHNPHPHDSLFFGSQIKKTFLEYSSVLDFVLRFGDLI